MASGSSKREKQKGQAIQVFVRSRPLNTQEHEVFSANVIDILNTKELAIRQQYGKRYTFDKVFGPKTSQMDVYANVVHPMIAEVIAGYNCTVFAYGQTGTGKTFTMAGGCEFSSEVAWQDDVDAGIIPRALSNLFDELNLIQQPYTVRVSYLELYNEELFDLLSHSVDGKGIRLFEDQHQKGSVIIHGITKETVYNKRQVYEILAKGQEKRCTASTLLNAQSSRSHTVFSIMVHTCETTAEGEEVVKTGKLNLVDLAGSENIGRSGATDRRAREAGNINQSLLTLGRVIKALVERTAHIPYRESKLTRILQDSLGGRTKTSIIATISPAANCLEETLSTLDYANRARNITNRPEVNQIVSQTAWKDLYEKELKTLRRDLAAASAGCGVIVAQENYDRLVHDSTIFKEELANKIAVVRELEQQVRNMEEGKQLQMAEWEQLQLSFAATKAKLAAYREKLKQTTEEKMTEEYLASCYENKTQVLHNQAQILLGATKQTITHFRKKIDDLCTLSQVNNQAVRNVTETVTQKFTDITNELHEFAISAYTCSESAAAVLNTIAESHKKSLDMGEMSTDALAENARKIVHIVCRDFLNSYQVDRERRHTSIDNLQNKLYEVQSIRADIQADLREINEEAESSFINIRNDILKQEQIGEEVTGELKAVGMDLLSIMTKVELLEQKMSQSEEIRKVLKDKLATTREMSQAKYFKLSSTIEDAAHTVTNALTVIDEMKEAGSVVNDTLQQLQTCRQNFEVTTTIEDNSELTAEICMNDVSCIATDYKVGIKNTQLEFTSNRNRLANCLTEIQEKVSEFQTAASSKILECQDDLSNCSNKCLIDPTASGGTPSRIPLDYGAMTVTPREQILKRFIEVRNKQELKFDDSLLSSPEKSPERNSESTTRPANIISPNIQQLKLGDAEQKTHELDIAENIPGPTGISCK